jgi:hypothetical protein
MCVENVLIVCDRGSASTTHAGEKPAQVRTAQLSIAQHSIA